MRYIKTILLSIFALALSFSANAQMQAARKVVNEMTIVGEITGAGNAKVTLEKVGTPGIIATVNAKGGKFTFLKLVGSLPYPFKLTVGDKSMLVALESGRFTIKGDINDLQNAEVKSPSSHGEFMTLLKMVDSAKTEREKDMQMELFMSKHSHSWISLYCLEVLSKKYMDNTMKMRTLLGYITHLSGSKSYDAIEKAVAAEEAKQE